MKMHSKNSSHSVAADTEIK